MIIVVVEKSEGPRSRGMLHVLDSARSPAALYARAGKGGKGVAAHILALSSWSVAMTSTEDLELGVEPKLGLEELLQRELAIMTTVKCGRSSQ